jgi:hypothetical protein
MNAAIPFAILLYSCVMGGIAVWYLWKSPDERQSRQSFYYNYGAFFFYAILSAIGIVVLVSMYQSGALTNFLTRTAVGGGLSDFIGWIPAYLLAPFMASAALKRDQKNGLLPGVGAAYAASGSVSDVAARKSRRQVGHGRYHT